MYEQTNNYQKGKLGEAICSEYLKKQSYKILCKNWYCNWGEIDLVAGLDGKLVFIEVKSVNNTSYCNPVELFSKNKQRKLLRAIYFFLSKYKVKRWQLDLVCITQDHAQVWIEHYKNVLAF